MNTSWTEVKRAVPLRTYSGRVVYDRPKHVFTIRDATRILERLQPSQEESTLEWGEMVLRMLQQATISMLSRILYMLPPNVVSEIYFWAIGILDKFFQAEGYGSRTAKNRAIDLAYYAAGKGGFEIELSGDR